MFAAYKGNTEVIKLFLAREDVDPGLKDDNGQTALMVGAERGNAEVIKLLIARGDVDPSLKDNNGRSFSSSTAINPYISCKGSNWHGKRGIRVISDASRSQ